MKEKIREFEEKKFMNCKICNKDFERKESVRIYGEVPINSGCCSSQCYTKLVTQSSKNKEDTIDFSVKEEDTI